MAKRTMSGSEMLAHSRNRHEQKSLKERLDELSQSEFLVRDTSRVETHRWRQFLRENHRSTGWSPMAMKPDIPSEEDGACADNSEQSVSSPRRRYDLQAIKKYQRPWACTLKTGDSYNKVYRELAEAGESSQKALYTPRQATLALMGVASFAKGKLFNKHPRLAQTVPAVVGIERARSAWVPGSRSQVSPESSIDKLPNSRLTLKSAPSSQQYQQSGTMTELEPQVRTKREDQNSSLILMKKATAALIGNDKMKGDFFSDAVNTSYKNSESSKVKFQHLSKMGQSVLDLNRLRKSVDRWKCCMCGGDNRPAQGMADDKGEDEEVKVCKSSLYDASTALKGLNRAKTALDGILYKDEKGGSCESDDTTLELNALSNDGLRCSCKHNEAIHEINERTSGLRLGRAEESKQSQLKQKTQKKKQQSAVNSKNQKDQSAVQKNAVISSEKAKLTRRKGVVCRPQGLFENCGKVNHNSSNDLDKSLQTDKGVDYPCPKKVLSDTEPLNSTILSAERKEYKENNRKVEYPYNKNCVPSQSNLDFQTGPDLSQKMKGIKDKSQNDILKKFNSCSDSKTFPHEHRLETSTGSLISEDDNEELSPLFLTDDVFNQQGYDNTDSLVNSLGEAESLSVKPDTNASIEEFQAEINKARQDEKLELRDKFDAYPIGKSRTRHLSTVKRRKFSFVSSAVGAFVKNSSSDDLRNNSRQSRVRSFSVTSQASVESASVDCSDNQRGRKNSKWQLENIICASSLARYAGRATRNEKGEISYTRPWRQKKKKEAKLEVNVFYAIARFMLRKQQELRKMKEAQKDRSDKKADNGETHEKNIEESDLESRADNVAEPIKSDKASPLFNLSPTLDLRRLSGKTASQCKRFENAQSMRAPKKTQDRGSLSLPPVLTRGAALVKKKPKLWTKLEVPWLLLLIHTTFPTWLAS